MVKKRLDSEDNETPTKDMKDGEKPMGKSHSRENQIRKQVNIPNSLQVVFPS